MSLVQTDIHSYHISVNFHTRHVQAQHSNKDHNYNGQKFHSPIKKGYEISQRTGLTSYIDVTNKILS